MGDIGNYAPRGLSPQTDGILVIQSDTAVLTTAVFACLSDLCITLTEDRLVHDDLRRELAAHHEIKQ